MKCGNCDTSLDGIIDEPGQERTPCPICGSTKRVFEVSIKEEIFLRDQFDLLGKRAGRSIAFRQSPWEGKASAADIHGDGSLSHSMDGGSPKGEEDSQRACRLLIAHLNSKGDNWQEPNEGVADVDWEAKNPSTDRTLSMQVTRVIVDPNFWRQVSVQKGFTERNIKKERLHAYIKAAIEHKVRTIISKGNITLVLDATRLPLLSFEDVVFQFREIHQEWIAMLGFDAIWIVGPSDELVWRLD
jgi:hypothetical protein